MYRYVDVAMKRGAGDPSPDYKATVEVRRSGSGRRLPRGPPAPPAGRFLAPRYVEPTGECSVASSIGGVPPPGIRLQRLETPEECRAVEEVQRAAWGFATDGPVPAAIQRAIAHNGGLLLGAFEGAQLIGFALGFLGREGPKLYHYSHMTAVRPEAQNRHVGFALKVFQRQEVLRQDLSEVRWTFDPLQSKNALLNVRRLGGVPDRYYPRYYGMMADAINEGLETDRLRLIWPLNDPRVVARLGGRLPAPADDGSRYRSSSALVETVIGPSGLRRPGTVRPPVGPRLHLEIPYDLGSVRSRDPGGSRRWRELTREAFTAALEAGYRVDDFAVVPLAGERRSFYFFVRDGAP
jgi:predicted GNAT superfamily acetyltransferase